MTSNLLAEAPMLLSEKQETSVLDYLVKLVKHNSMDTFRRKYELADALIHRTLPVSPLDQSKLCLPTYKKALDLEFTVPIISPQIDTIKAYLSATFLSTQTIFPVTLAPGNDDLMGALNDTLDKYATQFQWRKQLISAFDNAAKYNIMPVEVTWNTRKVTATTGERSPNGKVKLGTDTWQSGFAIKSLDPYNTFWDTSVAASDVAINGTVAGYIEKYSKFRLAKLLLELPEVKMTDARKLKLLNSTNSRATYYTPNFSGTRVARETDFNDFFSPDQEGSSSGDSTSHEVITMYVRLFPDNYGLPNYGNKFAPKTYKVILVNQQFIIYFAERTNMHGLLPILVGQPKESNLSYDEPTIAEELSSIQNLASSFWTAEINSIRRILSDRAIYDPSVIPTELINKADVTSKIPVLNKAYGASLGAAYHQIPYNDPGLGQRSNVASQLASFAYAITGQNQVGMGQFVKGNKTDGQFQEVLSRSDNRQIVMALALSDQFFSPLKEILKADILQYQEPLKLPDGTTASLDNLLDLNLDFEINDKLKFSKTDIETQDLMALLNSLNAIQDVDTKFDRLGALLHMFSLKGVEHLSAYTLAQKPTQEVTGSQNPGLDYQSQMANVPLQQPTTPPEGTPTNATVAIPPA